MFGWTAGLFRLRGEHEAFTSGEQQDEMADGTVIAYLRGKELGAGCKAGGAERVLVVVNKDGAARDVELSTARTGLEGCNSFKAVFPTNAGEVMVGDGKVVVPVSANGAGIYAVQ
jgi:hypothetical protein